MDYGLPSRFPTVIYGGTILGLMAITYATHRWQEGARERQRRPKRQFLLHRQMEEFLTTFEKAALADAEQHFAPLKSISQPARSKMEPCRARALLDQVSISDCLVPLKLARLCDLDEDLVNRVTITMMHIVSLRVVIQPKEAEEGTSVHGLRLPKSYFPFDSIFHFGRFEWESRVLDALVASSLHRWDPPDASSPSLRDKIKWMFVHETLPILQTSVTLTHSIGWRLFATKVIGGHVGPVCRSKRRQLRVLTCVVGLILGTAFLEGVSYFNVLVQHLTHIGALGAIVRAVERGPTVGAAATDSKVQSEPPSSMAALVRPQVIVMWVKTGLLLLRAFTSPWLDQLATKVRLELQAEWAFELSVVGAQMDEPMRSQHSFQKVCSPSSSKRLAAAVADWMVKGCIEHYGRTFGCLAILGHQLYCGQRFLPLAAFLIGYVHSGAWIPSCGLSRVWPFSAHDYESVSGTMGLLDRIDDEALPVSEKLCGARLLLQAVAEEFKPSASALKRADPSFRPFLSLLLVASCTTFGEMGSIPVYDLNVTSLFPVVALAHELHEKKHDDGHLSPLRSSALLRSLWKQFEFSHQCCLLPAANALSSETNSKKKKLLSAIGIHAHDNEGPNISRNYLDGEEVDLMSKGASRYLLVSRSYYKLFLANRYHMLRTLGIDVLHAYCEVSHFRTARYRSIWQAGGAFLGDAQLDDIILTFILMSAETLGHEVVLTALLTNILPAWWQPATRLAHNDVDEQKSYCQVQMGKLLAYRNIFERIGFGRSLFSRVHGVDSSRVRKAKEMEELMTVLPLLQQGNADQGNSLLEVRRRLVAAHPHLSFSDDGYVTGGFSLRRGVTFQGVTLIYPGSSTIALSNVHFNAPAGLTTAIIGKSGSGKSSLIQLLKGVYRPIGDGWESTILLDDIPLHCFDRAYLRSIITQVPQHPYVVPHFTFAQNIALYRPATMAQVQRAARLANCESFILATPLGYHSLAGAHLSGGEMQRLEIARAVFGDPQVLILDEATSKLDAITESSVQETFSSLQCTILTVAHRMSTLRNADRYIVMHEGRVLEEGTHDELMHHSNVDDSCDWSYRRQLELQSLASVGNHVLKEVKSQ